jgi:hypothetical protein
MDQEIKETVMKKTIILGCAFILSTLVMAPRGYALDNTTDGSATDQTVTSVLKQFLSEANNPKSSVGTAIAKINSETEDGRNSKGTIALPLDKSAVHIVLLSHEQTVNAWHYAELQGTECVAYGDDSAFLVLVDQQTNVHMASIQSSILFKVSTRQKYTMSILNKSAKTCDPTSEEGADYSNLKMLLEIDEFSATSFKDDVQ